jgi:hypothetical protein
LPEDSEDCIIEFPLVISEDSSLVEVLRAVIAKYRGRKVEVVERKKES